MSSNLATCLGGLTCLMRSMLGWGCSDFFTPAAKAGILWIRPRSWVEYRRENASIAPDSIRFTPKTFLLVRFRGARR
jgi:hypothetical protein